ncbi:MAG: hypothetical protein K6E91_03815 [Butyrivibrio sp.]|nr:hypothetical protein [Butyrivibrio sp.]
MKRALTIRILTVAATALMLVGTVVAGRSFDATDMKKADERTNASSASAQGYTTRKVKLVSYGQEDGEIDLRFYDVTPNIPYMGMNQYAQLLGRQPFSVRAAGEWACEMESWNGAKLICNTSEGSIFVKDWNSFFGLPMPIEDRAMGLKDMSVHFARIVDIDYKGSAAPVTIDFAKYGIEIYCDENDIYLPVSTLSNVMTDIATNFMLYNGEKLYLRRVSLDGSIIDGMYGSDVLLSQIHGKERPEDIIKQCYADLCLNFDYFFGFPGIAALEQAIAEKGLDEALDSLGEDGQDIKKGLFSSSFEDYLYAMIKLFDLYLSDGHTVFSSGSEITVDSAVSEDAEFTQRVQSFYIEYLKNNDKLMQQVRNALIPVQREIYWGEDTYREYGSTAIIRLDSFVADEEAWADYYSEGGELPSDDLGIVISGLKKASENSKIRNIIFDLTCNGGGSPDVMMTILALTTGQDKLNGMNTITDQPMTVTFEIDANFDGVYDEKDKEAKYDYNYGVLITNYAFSCGNLFPFVIQDAGAVVIGEPSSGGSCSIQIGSDIEGLYYSMSSGQWKLGVEDGELLENGCTVDVPIETTTMPVSELTDDPYANAVANYIGRDAEVPKYQDYFDDKSLDDIMNEWFSTQAQEDKAG